jgi:hypothetical protein
MWSFSSSGTLRPEPIMGFKINASTFLAPRILKVDEKGVAFADASFGSAKKFRFDQIDCVLLSPQNLLSFQVGRDLFSLPIRPDNKKHQQAVEAFLHAVKESQTRFASQPSA